MKKSFKNEAAVKALLFRHRKAEFFIKDLNTINFKESYFVIKNIIVKAFIYIEKLVVIIPHKDDYIDE